MTTDRSYLFDGQTVSVSPSPPVGSQFILNMFSHSLTSCQIGAFKMNHSRDMQAIIRCKPIWTDRDVIFGSSSHNIFYLPPRPSSYFQSRASNVAKRVNMPGNFFLNSIFTQFAAVIIWKSDRKEGESQNTWRVNTFRPTKRKDIAHLRKYLAAWLILVDCPVRCLFVLPPVCCLVQEFEVMTRELMILRYFRNRVHMYCQTAPQQTPFIIHTWPSDLYLLLCTMVASWMFGHP